MLDEKGSLISIFSQVQDVTERKRAEQALINSESFLNSVIEQSPVAIWISDKTGTLIRQNQACRDVFSVTDEEVVGNYNIFNDNLMKEKGLLPIICKVFEEGQTVRFSLDYDSSELNLLDLQRRFRKILDVNISPIRDQEGLITNAIINTLDITEQKRAEETLIKSQKLLNESQRIAHIGTWEWNIKTNDVVWTDEVYRIFGEPVQMFQPSFDDFIRRVHPDDRERVQESFIEALKIKKYENLEYHLVRPDKTERWALSTGDIFYDEAGSPVRIVGTVQDITDRKKIEEQLVRHRERLEELVEARTRELKAAQEELVKREKLAILGQLTATVSHEIRNPLGVIQFSSFYLQRHTSDSDKKYIKHLQRIEKQVDVCVNIVDDLLEYTRGRHAKMIKGHINPWIESILVHQIINSYRV